MVIAVSVGLDGGGATVSHRADAAGREALRRRGARLQAASHPGVVVVRCSEAAGDGWVLTTAHAGHPVAPARLLGARELARVGAGAAATLADLHDRGVAHGHLVAGHLLTGRGGSVVLCGFGADDGGAGPADDVAALGAVLAELAEAMAAQGRAREADLEPLRALATAAQADPPTRRPPARRLAAELEALAAGSVPAASGPLAGRRAPVLALVAIAALVALAGLGVGWGGGHRADGATSAPAEPSTSRTSSSTPAAEARCVARPGAPTRAATCGADAAVEGHAVVVDGLRTVVGRPGDDVLVADWGCTGTTRPALLRPATGEVLVFSPPDAHGAREVTHAAQVPGARRLVAATDGLGCTRPAVERADGAVVAVALGTAGPEPAAG